MVAQVELLAAYVAAAAARMGDHQKKNTRVSRTRCSQYHNFQYARVTRQRATVHWRTSRKRTRSGGLNKLTRRSASSGAGVYTGICARLERNRVQLVDGKRRAPGSRR